MRLSRAKAKDLSTKVALIRDRSSSVEEIDAQVEEAKESIVTRNGEMDRLKSLIRVKEDRLSVIRADINIDQSSSLYVKELEDRIRSMTNQLVSLREDKAKVEDRSTALSSRIKTLSTRHTSAKAEYVSLQEVLDSTDPSALNKELTFAKESLSEAQGSLVKTESVKLSLQARTKDIKVKKSKLEKLDTECPMCLREVDEESKHTILHSLDDQMSELDTELDSVMADILSYREAENTSRNIVSKVSRELDTINSSGVKSRSLKQTLIDLKTTVEELNSEIENTSSHVTDLESKIDELTVDLAAKKEEFESYSKLIAGEKDLTDITKELSSLKEELGQHNVSIGSLNERIKTLTKSKVQAGRDDTEIQELEGEIADLKIIGDMFSKTGIQSMIVANTCVEVQSIVNDYLSQISDNRMSIAIEVDAGQFDIIVNHGGTIKKLEQLSEGEKVRVAFAIRMAFSMLLHRRANGQGIEFLLIDEAIQNLDESGIEKFAEELVGLHNTLGIKIFLITHRTDIRNYFDERLIVDMIDGVSKVSVV